MSTAMAPAALLRSFREDARRVADAARRSLSAPVVHCPGWTVADLVVHLGVVHRWAAETVATGSSERVRGAVDRWGVPTDHPDLAGWYTSCADHLAGVLEAADLDAPVWTFGPPQTNRFWVRRQAQETAVHRWDAELAATGAPSPIDSDVAADGVDEALSVVVPMRRLASTAVGRGETFHLHRTDGDGEWLVRFPEGGRGVDVTQEHAKGDLAVRGPASSLLLWLWGRLAIDDPSLERFGDPGMLDRWTELAPSV